MNDIKIPTFCATHPDIETSLRCNRCGKPICPKCAVATPTGYRCQECVQGQQKIFETAVWHDYLIGGLIAAGLALAGSYIVPRLGFFTIILGPVAGGIIAEVVRVITNKRRAKQLFKIIATATLVGCLPVLLTSVVVFFVYLSQGSLASVWSLLWKVVYSITVTSTVYYRLAGIQINV